MNQAEPETGGDSDGRTRQEIINDISRKAGYMSGRTNLTKPICNSVYAYLTGSFLASKAKETGGLSPTAQEYREAISDEVPGLEYTPRDATGEGARPFRKAELNLIDKRMAAIGDHRPWTPDGKR